MTPYERNIFFFQLRIIYEINLILSLFFLFMIHKLCRNSIMELGRTDEY